MRYSIEDIVFSTVYQQHGVVVDILRRNMYRLQLDSGKVVVVPSSAYTCKECTWLVVSLQGLLSAL